MRVGACTAMMPAEPLRRWIRARAIRSTRFPCWLRHAGRNWACVPRLCPDFRGSLALWRLQVDSELVYVGDAGVTEPRARPASGVGSNSTTVRQPRRWLLVDAETDGLDPMPASTNGDRIANGDLTGSARSRSPLGNWAPGSYRPATALIWAPASAIEDRQCFVLMHR